MITCEYDIYERNNFTKRSYLELPWVTFNYLKWKVKQVKKGLP